jgi:hypothetical protein
MKCTADLRSGFDKQTSIIAMKVQKGIPTKQAKNFVQRIIIGQRVLEVDGAEGW